MKIELIYFKGCPNIEAARENLKQALDSSTQWHEWEQSDKKAPLYIKKYGSPTILINKKDVTGDACDNGSANSCRLYKGGHAPSVKMITAALKKRAF